MSTGNSGRNFLRFFTKIKLAESILNYLLTVLQRNRHPTIGSYSHCSLLLHFSLLLCTSLLFSIFLYGAGSESLGTALCHLQENLYQKRTLVRYLKKAHRIKELVPALFGKMNLFKESSHGNAVKCIS